MAISGEFYSTTAQIIPTLLITLALERKFLERSPDEPPMLATLFVSTCVGALVAGEIAALAGVAGVGWSGLAPLIVFALGVGSSVIVASFVVGYLADSFEAQKERGITRPLATGCAGGLAVLLALCASSLPVLAGTGITLWMVFAG